MKTQRSFYGNPLHFNVKRMTTNNGNSVPTFLENGGEMGRVISGKDWSSHPLGEPENWSLPLKFAINSMLKTAFPNFIFWGKDFRCFYNDAYRPSLGKEGKHPHILGQKGIEAWPEIWDTIEPLLKHVWNTGQPTWSENQLIPFYRNGQIENIYWTFSYSALMGADEKIAGILTTCTETTNAVLNLRRLEESEEQLAFAIEAAELGTWDYDPKTDRFLANDRLKEWWGLGSAPEINLSEAIEAIVEEDRERVVTSIKKALNGANNGKYDETYSVKNLKTHDIIIVRSLGQVRFNKEGVSHRFNGTTQDVTKEVKSAQNLKEAHILVKKEEERIRSILQNVPVGIAILRGEAYVYEMANTAYLEIVDRDQDEIMHRPIFDILPEIKENVAPVLKKVRRSGQPIRDMEFKVPLKRKGQMDDAYFNLVFQPMPSEHGTLPDILIVAIEVTDYVIARSILTQNEIQFRNLVMQSPIAMAIFRGEELRIEMANERMLDHFWNRTWNDVIGERLIDVFPELKTQKYLGILEQVIEKGKEAHAKDAKIIVVNDSIPKEFYVNYDYLPLSEIDGRISGVMVTVTDVTEQHHARQKLVHFSKELEKEVNSRTVELRETNKKLRHSVKKLKSANTELESFAYVSSHDLQEPLRKIQMFISRFEDEESGTMTSAGKRYFDKINNSAIRMRVLIDDLLEYSRTEEDRAKLEPTDLNDILRQVLDNLSTQVERTKADITVARLPMVHAIPFQMRQVFSNLIGNALKFSNGQAIPKIGIDHKTTSGKHLGKLGLKVKTTYHKISVTDNGIGFAKGMEDKIFEVFQRLHGKQKYEGTGIGLAIVKKIMHNHEGAVTAQSQEGHGATFSIFLPKVKRDNSSS